MNADDSSVKSAYPSTMSSPYFTGTLVEVVVMFSCSGEYIGHGWSRFGGGGVERRMRFDKVRETGRGKEGKGRGSADQMEHGGKGGGGGGKGRVSCASALPSHASCVRLLQRCSSRPAE